MRKEAPLSTRIKFARQRASFSLDRLAAEVGTSRQHLIRLEKGLHKPKPDMAQRIATATGVPLELLQDDEDEEDAVEALMLALRRVLEGRAFA